MRSTRLLTLPLATLALTAGLSACGGSSTEYPDAGGGADPATGPALRADGFTVRAPDGWADTTSQFKRLQSMVTVGASAPTTTDGFRTNLNVIAKDGVYSGSEPSDSDLTQGEQQIPGTLKQQAGATAVSKQPRSTVAGAVALHFTSVASVQGTAYDTSQYYVFHDGSEYTVTFSFPRSTSESEQARVTEPVLASWSWAG